MLRNPSASPEASCLKQQSLHRDALSFGRQSRGRITERDSEIRQEGRATEDRDGGRDSTDKTRSRYSRRKICTKGSED